MQKEQLKTRFWYKILQAYKAIRGYLKTPKEKRKICHALKFCKEIFDTVGWLSIDINNNNNALGEKEIYSDDEIQKEVVRPLSFKEKLDEELSKLSKDVKTFDFIPVGKKVSVQNLKTMEWDQVGWVLKREDSIEPKYNVQIIDYNDADKDGTKIWCGRKLIRPYRTKVNALNDRSESPLPTSTPGKKRTTTITFREDLNDIKTFNPESPGRIAQFRNKSPKITRELKRLMDDSKTQAENRNKSVNEKGKRACTSTKPIGSYNENTIESMEDDQDSLKRNLFLKTKKDRKSA